jgi:hypothetical protein
MRDVKSWDIAASYLSVACGAAHKMPERMSCLRSAAAASQRWRPVSLFRALPGADIGEAGDEFDNVEICDLQPAALNS